MPQGHNERAVLNVVRRSAKPIYGREVMSAIGLPSGSVYPILRRLESKGILFSEWEDVDPSQVRRPRRRLYRFNRSASRALLTLLDTKPAPVSSSRSSDPLEAALRGAILEEHAAELKWALRVAELRQEDLSFSAIRKRTGKSKSELEAALRLLKRAIELIPGAPDEGREA